ncbi:hypothetical protein NDU88_000424 [Pleurodeles waltl]|uniref:Uncharacterized protein n=1 Tax=Pleurodeles waltl TaxID=8319 RepID=A0AAV7LA52_PLEWA|nr:hypothetical protein NDU88_000424 [Pleurodeles waltl]
MKTPAPVTFQEERGFHSDAGFELTTRCLLAEEVRALPMALHCGPLQPASRALWVKEEDRALFLFPSLRMCMEALFTPSLICLSRAQR